jgi:hypothetical protein
VHFPAYVTVTENVGPVRVGTALLPAHTPIVIGAAVAVFATIVAGTPRGGSKTSVLPVDGHPPDGKVLVTEGLSAAVPWLSMQKNSC